MCNIWNRYKRQQPRSCSLQYASFDNWEFSHEITDAITRESRWAKRCKRYRLAACYVKKLKS